MAESDFSHYLTHSDEDLKWQLVCTDAGRREVPPGSSYPPQMTEHPVEFRPVATGRRLSEYQMVYVLAGRGTFTVEASELPVEAGSLILLFPGVPHAYQPDTRTGWIETWVGFHGPHMDALWRCGVVSPERSLFRPGLRATLLGRFAFIAKLATQQSPLYQFQASAEILGILAEVLAVDRLSRQQDSSQEIVERVKAFVADNIDSDLDLMKLAKATKQSRATLNGVFKAYIGMTPHQYFLSAKINRAKDILASGEASVKQIAWSIGFDDPLYFSRLFKKKTGRTPSQWMNDSAKRMPH